MIEEITLNYYLEIPVIYRVFYTVMSVQVLVFDFSFLKFVKSILVFQNYTCWIKDSLFSSKVESKVYNAGVVEDERPLAA